MTAEIAVMNKSAVALAADSAVTLTMHRGHKIYTTNKLFTLSKYHPVGIMIYGEAELLDVPWETVLKTYRKQLGTVKYGTLREYSDDFINYIENTKLLFSEAIQKDFFRTSLRGYYTLIKEEIDEEIRKHTQRRKITKQEIEKIVNSVINKRSQDLEKLDMLTNFSSVDTRNLLTKYASIIKKVKDDVFVKLPVSTTSNNNLRKIAGYLFTRKIFQEKLSGVVVAGFGDNEIFPHVRSLEIEGIVNGKVKCKDAKEHETNESTTACIIPFAQAEMVATFMEGVEPSYQKYLFRGLSSLLAGKYPNYIVEQIADLSKTKREALASKLQKVGKGVVDELQKQLRSYREKTHINPITTAVSFLPKEELAVMAETLVNLTSFKRKISIDAAETVGGPIDVAVISKADGFVWIKRKHYFEPQLNPHFTTNYFREL